MTSEHIRAIQCGLIIREKAEGRVIAVVAKKRGPSRAAARSAAIDPVASAGSYVGKYAPCGPSCTDSDGGNNPQTAGSVKYSSGAGLKTYTDYCVASSMLAEYSCVAALPKVTIVRCASTCSAGACVGVKLF